MHGWLWPRLPYLSKGREGRGEERGRGGEGEGRGGGGEGSGRWWGEKREERKREVEGENKRMCLHRKKMSTQQYNVSTCNSKVNSVCA